MVILYKMKKVFDSNNGYASTDEIRKRGIAYSDIQKHLKAGKIKRIRRGFYKWHITDETNEAATVAGLFPDGVLCMDTALFHYGYSDRTPAEWHIAVDKDSSKIRFNISYPFVKPYYFEPDKLIIGITKEMINGIEVSMYDRDRVICDCLRNINKMDKEIFNKAIQSYVADSQKNISNLTAYAKKLHVYKKVQSWIGVWL